MDPLRASVIQSNYPAIRRKNTTNLHDIIKEIGGSFITYLQFSTPGLKSRPSLRDSEQLIEHYYTKIHDLIDSFDENMSKKLEDHQNQVFSIVKGEIEAMRVSTHQMVDKLNKVIKEKNTEDEIWKLSNQLDYFKAQTFKLFQDNKKLRKQMTILKTNIREYQIELETSDMAMQKFKKKQMKAKLLMKKSQQIKNKYGPDKFLKTQSEFTPENRNKQAGKKIKTEYAVERNQSSQVRQLSKQSSVSINMQGKSGFYMPIQRFNTDLTQLDPLAEIDSEAAQTKRKFIEDIPDAIIRQISSSQYQDEDNEILYSLRANKQVQTSFDKHQNSAFNLEKLQVPAFSKTSQINASNEQQKKQKHIDFIKNGFHIRSYNQRSSTMYTPGLTPSPPLVQNQPARHTRYISKALQNNKVFGKASRQKFGVTSSTNK